jgi:hypothetical protein
MQEFGSLARPPLLLHQWHHLLPLLQLCCCPAAYRAAALLLSMLSHTKGLVEVRWVQLSLQLRLLLAVLSCDACSQ